MRIVDAHKVLGDVGVRIRKQLASIFAKDATCRAGGTVPACDRCQGSLRPQAGKKRRRIGKNVVEERGRGNVGASGCVLLASVIGVSEGGHGGF